MNLLIINDFGIEGGGTENRINVLIDYFIRNDSFREIHILQQKIVCKRQKGKKSHADRRIKIHYCPSGYLRSYLFTKEIIKKHSIGFVQAHNMMGMTPAPVLAAKSMKKPVVWYAHDYWAMCTFRNFIDPYNAIEDKLCGKARGKRCTKCRMRPRSLLKLRLWKAILNRSDIAIASSRTMARLYKDEGIMGGRWKTVSPWINPLMLKKTGDPAESGIKRGMEILFVGSLVEFKGAWVAVRALKQIIKRVPGASLVFIGGEQDKGLIHRNKIDSMARKEGVLGNIRFMGQRSQEEIKEKLGRAGAYVCPTVCMEAFGLNWAEAMAAGCPVVASRIGSIPEFISQKDQNGLLFEPRNHCELAQKVIMLLEDRHLSGKLGQNGADYAVSHFDIEAAGKKILSIYNNMKKS